MINKKMWCIGLILVLSVISLNLVYAETYTDESSSEFDLNLNYPICSADGLNWINYALNPPVLTPTTGDNGNCYSPEGFAGTKCCPESAECIEKDGSGKCYSSSVDFCHQYTTQEECDDYTNHVAENTIETIEDDDKFCDGKILAEYADGQSCWDVVKDCICKWSDDITKNCTAKFLDQSYCENAWIEPPNEECVYSISNWDDRCEIDGFIYASWAYTGGELCSIAETIQIPCSKITRLDFFNWINLIAAVLIIGVIYYLYSRKKEIKKKKR